MLIFVKKNALPLLIVGFAVGLVVYMTKREGFQITTQPFPRPIPSPIPPSNKCTIELPLGPQQACRYLNQYIPSNKQFEIKKNKCVRTGTFNTETRTCSL